MSDPADDPKEAEMAFDRTAMKVAIADASAMSLTPDDQGLAASEKPLKYPFSASGTKIRRARKHLAELGQVVADFIASKPVKFEIEVNKDENGNPPFKILMNMGAVPEDLGAIVGDVIHNLRSALGRQAERRGCLLSFQQKRRR